MTAATTARPTTAVSAAQVSVSTTTAPNDRDAIVVGQSADLQKKLKRKGHEARVTDLNSGLHGISVLPEGRLLGGADPRREGVALGAKD